jgi:hypothetical protein
MAGARRSGRITKEISIFLCGTDISGHIFSEETKTVVLSRHGAGILSRHKLVPDEILTIRLAGTSAEAPLRLVGQMGQETRGYTYGVEFLDPELDFWELKFPPPLQWHSNPDSTLECCICHAREVVRQSEVEADVYALLRNILRFCPTCGTSTAWHAAPDDGSASPDIPLGAARRAASPVLVKQAVPARAEMSLVGSLTANSYSDGTSSSLDQEVYAAETLVDTLESSATQPFVPQNAPQSSSQMAPPISSNGKNNRRRYLRSQVHFTVRVRHADLGDETVESDDISKGGFSFRSLKAYPQDCLIEAAVPYTPGWDAIFVSARIKHIEGLPGGTLFRYGAAYTLPPKSPRNS